MVSVIATSRAGWVAFSRVRRSPKGNVDHAGNNKGVYEP
jgi:hypothetical protein